MRERDGREPASARGSKGGPPSKLRVIWEALGSIPERLRRPESLLMMLALLASVGVHMPPYLGLGALADYFERLEREHKKEAAPPITFDVVSEPAPAPPAKPERRELAKPEPERVKPPPEAPKRREPEPEKPKPEPEQKVAAAAVPPPEPKREERKQSITQKSDDPDVEPPPDPKYLADENRRVQEESVASITSETKDDATLQAAAPQAAGAEHSGDSRDEERGAEKGSKEEREQRMASRQRAPTPIAPRPPEPAQQQPIRPGRPQAPEPRVEPPSETVVRDPLGTFVLAPSNPSPSARSAPTASGAQTSRSPSLKVSWRAFEQTFGAEQLAQDRMPKEAKRRGAGREKRWEEFRAAIENYIVGVRPGNMTALNAAADPFAAYLASFHRNLHMEFAHQFLASLPMAGALGDPSLVTKVEIVVNADGSLDRVGVVKSSGNMMYDFGAFNAVQRGAPYPPTPEKIRSPDGRVYMRWALHRNESQCGTWNAEPYILRTPPRSPNDPKQDNVSPYRPGGGEGEHGSAPRDEPHGPSDKTPAVAPGETLGAIRRPSRTGLA